MKIHHLELFRIYLYSRKSKYRFTEKAKKSRYMVRPPYYTTKIEIEVFEKNKKCSKKPS